MSVISASTTILTAYKVEGDTNGNLVFKTGATPSTAMTISSAQVVSLANPLPASSGGTGTSATPTNGQIAIGNGSGFTLSTITAGSGISITNGSGSITIANSSTGGAQDFIVQSYGIT